MILAVVGSEHLTPDQLYRASLLIKWALFWLKPKEVCSGGAFGVDKVAEGEAGLAEIPFREFKPQNARWEPKGYKDRNMEVAEYCDMMLCIRGKDSVRYGSGWTADYADDALGKVVWRFYV